MEVCPTEVIDVAARRVWQLLTDPIQFAQWSGTKLDEAPASPVRAGDSFVVSKGGLRVRVQVMDASPVQHLTLDVHLPFGVVNHERVQLIELSASTCRVTFN